MKKLKMLVLLLACVCSFGFIFTGCEPENNSKNVTVISYIDSTETDRYVVDIHNGALLTEVTTAPTGKEFYGWSTVENWEEGSNDFVIEGGYITYKAVKDVAQNGQIKLYPAFKTRTNYYFVFGWYSKTSTSGLNEETMATVETALRTYLQGEGATTEQLALVDVRAYDGDVATYGGNIMRDADVDVFVGCGNNINTDGGVSIVTKSNAFSINGVTKRRFILLNYDDLSIKVYNWFQQYIHDNFDGSYTVSNYTKVECTVTYALGANAGLEAVAPATTTVYKDQKLTLPEAPAPADNYLFAGWKIGEEETLKQAGDEITITDDVTITAQYTSGYTVTYSNGLATRTSATVAPTSATNLANGATVTLPDAPTAKAGFVFAGWRVGEELKTAGATISVTDDITVTAEYTLDATIDTTITIGYYTSGGFDVDDPIITNVKTAFETYLANNGITTGYGNITYKAYSGKVAPAGGLITDDLTASINVGVVIGFGANLATTGGVEYKERTSGFTMGTSTGRYVYRLTDSAISNVVYDWMVSANSTFVTAVQTPAE